MDPLLTCDRSFVTEIHPGTMSGPGCPANSQQHVTTWGADSEQSADMKPIHALLLAEKGSILLPQNTTTGIMVKILLLAGDFVETLEVRTWPGWGSDRATGRGITPAFCSVAHGMTPANNCTTLVFAGVCALPGAGGCWVSG
jgi:hypothetical protein